MRRVHISGLLLSGADLRPGHNGICASSPHQVIGLEWPAPNPGSEEAGLTGCAIVGGSSISLEIRFTVPADGVKMVSAGEAEASSAREQLAKE